MVSILFLSVCKYTLFLSFRVKNAFFCVLYGKSWSSGPTPPALDFAAMNVTQMQLHNSRLRQQKPREMKNASPEESYSLGFMGLLWATVIIYCTGSDFEPYEASFWAFLALVSGVYIFSLTQSQLYVGTFCKLHLWRHPSASNSVLVLSFICRCASSALSLINTSMNSVPQCSTGFTYCRNTQSLPEAFVACCKHYSTFKLS